MAQDKRQVDAITARDVDFAQWYTDVCKKAELIDYTSVKGMFIYRPYGYAIWENIQAQMDRRFKETGHENVYLPVLIPESLLQKEKDHVEGFDPPSAPGSPWAAAKSWRTASVSAPPLRRCSASITPTLSTPGGTCPSSITSGAAFCAGRRPPVPSCATREFLWQEGHTMHATEEEAREETMRMLNIYADFMENVLAMPVLRGRKTDKEKFNGAEETYTVECMMHDHKALQAGTSHYFGDGFARAFDITFTGKDNTLHYPHQTSLGGLQPE